MKRGYVHLWRRSLDSAVFAHEGIWKLFCLCLMKANHKEGEVMIPGVLQPIKLRPGQFITGRDALHYAYHQGHIRKRYSQKLRPVARTLQRWLLTLSKMQVLSIKTHPKYSIITITNWSLYQKIVQLNAQYRSTNNNDGRMKNIYSLNSDEFRLSELLLNLILERRNAFKRPDLQEWAKHINLMIRIDQRDPQELERIIRWCQSDPFWQNNILSTGKLRKQYDQLAMKMEESDASSKPKRFDEEDWQS